MPAETGFFKFLVVHRNVLWRNCRRSWYRLGTTKKLEKNVKWFFSDLCRIDIEFNVDFRHILWPSWWLECVWNIISHGWKTSQRSSDHDLSQSKWICQCLWNHLSIKEEAKLNSVISCLLVPHNIGNTVWKLGSFKNLDILK